MYLTVLIRRESQLLLGSCRLQFIIYSIIFLKTNFAIDLSLWPIFKQNCFESHPSFEYLIFDDVLFFQFFILGSIQIKTNKNVHTNNLTTHTLFSLHNRSHNFFLMKYILPPSKLVNARIFQNRNDSCHDKRISRRYKNSISFADFLCPQYFNEQMGQEKR